jgi:streptomycin 3"-adenylyltransferase
VGYERKIDAQLAQTVRHLKDESPGDVVGIYLFGSAASSGVRPDSDIDLLVVTKCSMSTTERRRLVDLFLAVSGWKGHAGRFPDAVERRPIELISVVTFETRS